MNKLFRSGLSACLILCSCASTPPPPPPMGSDRSSMNRWFDAWARSEATLTGVEGLSIALVDAQGADTLTSFGNAGKGRKVDERSLFNVGSVSKILMPIAVLVLAERGQMDLDAPVARYVPEFTARTPSGRSETITIRTLLTHHSGLVSDIQAGWFLDASARPSGTEYRSIVGLLNSIPTASEPWTQHSYSNAAFSLLAVAVERASGRDYTTLVQDSILRPWAMDDSGFAYAGLDPEFLVQGMVDGREVPVPAIRDLPAGLFCSSARDMARLIRGLLADQAGSGRVLKATSIAELWKVQNSEVGRDVGLRMGLSFVLRPMRALGLDSLAWHDGELTPFRAELCVDPVRGLGAFVVANSGTVGLGSFLVQGMRTLMGVRSGQDPLPAASPEPSPVVPTPQNWLADLPGVYQLPTGLMNVTRRGDNLVGETFGLNFRLKAHQDSSLTLHPEFLGLFVGAEPFGDLVLKPVEWEGTMTLATRQGDIGTGLGKKLAPLALTPAWEKRLGPWQQVGGPNAYFLLYDAATGVLSADSQIAIRPVNDGEAVTDGYGRGKNERIEAGNDEKGPWLRYSGMELRPQRL